MNLAEYYIAKFKKLCPYKGTQLEAHFSLDSDAANQSFAFLLTQGNTESTIIINELLTLGIQEEFPTHEHLQLVPLFRVCTTKELYVSLNRLLCYDKTLTDILLSFSSVQLRTTLEAFWIYSSLCSSSGRKQRFAVLKELYGFSGTDYLPAIQNKLPGYTKIPSYLSVFTDKSLSLSHKLEKFNECHRRYPKLSTYLENYII